MDDNLQQRLARFAALDEEDRLQELPALDDLAVECELEGDDASVRAIYTAIAACDPPEGDPADLLAALLGHLSEDQDEAATLDPEQVSDRLMLGIEDQARDIIERAREWVADNG